MPTMSTNSPKPHPRAVELAPNPALEGESRPELILARAVEHRSRWHIPFLGGGVSGHVGEVPQRQNLRAFRLPGEPLRLVLQEPRQLLKMSVCPDEFGVD